MLLGEREVTSAKFIAWACGILSFSVIGKKGFVK